MRLSAAGLAIERSGRVVVRDVSFALAAGEMLQVTGPNGAGKSTLLRAIAGLLPLAAGALECEGLGEDEPLMARAHYLGHQDALKRALTATENLAFWAGQLGGGGISPSAALARLGLPQAAEFPVAYLSAGQKRRVALARLLVAHRPLWLLDEPATALDVASQALFAGILQAHLAGGGLVIAATHAPLGVAGARELRLGPLAPLRAVQHD